MQLSLSQTPKSISSANYLLRQYGGAAAAYSLQRLDTSTTNVVRARRSTDDAESNFTAEGVSGGSLREFALNNDADLIRFANQAAAADKRMYFDGSNDYVAFGNQSSIGIAESFSLTVDIVTSDDITNQQQIFDSSNSASDRFAMCVRDGEIRVAFYDTAYRYAKSYSGISANTKYSITFSYDGAGGSTLTVNGNASDGTNNPVNMSASGVSYVGIQQVSQPFKGLIYNVAVYSDAAFTTKVWEVLGYGNTNADWEDQVGSNDGTVNGSPALFSGQGFDAYVTTLYDQSGNGRDATQATAASQPQIVADGVVVTDGNGKPAMDFEGTDDYLQFSHSASQPFSIIFVHESDTTLAASNEFFDTLAGGRALIDQSGSDYRLFANLVAGSGIAVDTDPSLIFTVFNGASSLLAKNGVSSGTLNAGTSATGSINSIGLSSPSGSYYNGKISEFILYASDQSTSRTAIEANIASRYGITLA